MHRLLIGFYRRAFFLRFTGQISGYCRFHISYCIVKRIVKLQIYHFQFAFIRKVPVLLSGSCCFRRSPEILFLMILFTHHIPFFLRQLSLRAAAASGRTSLLISILSLIHAAMAGAGTLYQNQNQNQQKNCRCRRSANSNVQHGAVIIGQLIVSGCQLNIFRIHLAAVVILKVFLNGLILCIVTVEAGFSICINTIEDTVVRILFFSFHIRNPALDCSFTNDQIPFYHSGRDFCIRRNCGNSNTCRCSSCL